MDIPFIDLSQLEPITDIKIKKMGHLQKKIFVLFFIYLKVSKMSMVNFPKEM